MKTGPSSAELIPERVYGLELLQSPYKNVREICLKCAPRSRRDGNGERERNFGSLFII